MLGNLLRPKEEMTRFFLFSEKKTFFQNLHDIFRGYKHAMIHHHHSIWSRRSLEALAQNTILFSLVYMPKHKVEFFLSNSFIK